MDSNGDQPVLGTEAVGGSSAAGSSSRKPPRIDPLVYLRDFISNKKKVQFNDDWLDFDGHKIHRSTKCGLIIQKGGPLIDIGSVWWMFHCTSADRKYTQASTQAQNFTYIGIDRRGDLCDFLLGKSDTCQGLVKEVLEGKKRPREKAPRWPTKQEPESSLSDTLSYEDVAKRVRSVQDLDVVIRRPGKLVPNANMILKIAQDEWQSLASGSTKALPQSSKQTKAAVPLHVELEQMLRKDPSKYPIILVPNNKQAPINLLNIQDLLQEGTYTKPDEQHLLFFESTRAESVEVRRNMIGKQWTFEVRDSVLGWTKAEWYRTVLVVVDGNDWQFKNWPFDNLVDLFSTIRGVYFRDPGKPFPVHVNNWPVLKLMVPNESAKHRYAQLRDEIFVALEEFFQMVRVRKFTDHSKLDTTARKVEKLPHVL
jgi:hypothetical protein